MPDTKTNYKTVTKAHDKADTQNSKVETDSWKLSIHLIFSVGPATLSQTAYNETSFTIG